MNEDEKFMGKELIKYIISRIVDNAHDASEDYKKEKSEFNDGRCLAYYEVLDTIRNELIVHEFVPSEFGLEVKIENVI